MYFLDNKRTFHIIYLIFMDWIHNDRAEMNCNISSCFKMLNYGYPLSWTNLYSVHIVSRFFFVLLRSFSSLLLLYIHINQILFKFLNIYLGTGYFVFINLLLLWQFIKFTLVLFFYSYFLFILLLIFRNILKYFT